MANQEIPLTEKFSQSLPSKVKIVEVGPRDGLQNEALINGKAISAAQIKSH